MRLASAVQERYPWPVAEETNRAPDARAEANDAPIEVSVDQLGIPMSREPTLDDVRTDGVEHRRLAVGCTVGVALLLIGFYAARMLLFR